MHESEQKIFTYGLFRHGETIWNSEKRVQGHGNSPLTTRGVSTLKLWASQLVQENWQQILCSDLGRVQQSVEILNATLELPVTIDKSLREQHWGEWEGLKVKDVLAQYPEELTRQAKRGWDFRPPGGESRREVRDRFFKALEHHQSARPTAKTLVVCHLGVIKCAIYSVANRRFMEDEPALLTKDAMHTLTFNGSYALKQLNIPLN